MRASSAWRAVALASGLVAGAADIFLTYRTNPVIAVAEQPGLRQVEIDPTCNVGSAYGLAVCG